MTASLDQREAAVSAFLLHHATQRTFWDAVWGVGLSKDELNALQAAKDEAWEAFERLGVDLVLSQGMPVRDEISGMAIVSSDELEDGDGWRLKMEVA